MCSKFVFIMRFYGKKIRETIYLEEFYVNLIIFLIANCLKLLFNFTSYLC